jgi:hypothetical protein
MMRHHRGFSPIRRPHLKLRYIAFAKAAERAERAEARRATALNWAEVHPLPSRANAVRPCERAAPLPDVDFARQINGGFGKTVALQGLNLRSLTCRHGHPQLTH